MTNDNGLIEKLNFFKSELIASDKRFRECLAFERETFDREYCRLETENEKLRALLRNTKSDIVAVCCDHDGKVCFNGSDGDRKVIQDVLVAIEATLRREKT
jgi:hypothetical protein